MISWRKSITETMTKNLDGWSNVVHCTLTDEQLDLEFDDGYGREKGEAFTLWTKDYVYFPICYDGAEWAGSAPRNPCKKSLKHQGGG